LIKGLFKYLFLLIFVSAAIFTVAYMYREKTRPVEQFIQENILSHILPDTTGMGMVIDTTLTAEEELALEINRRQDELAARSTFLDSLELAVNSRRDSIQIVRDQVLALQSDLTEQEQANLDKLAKVYEAMKPAEASQILLQLNDRTIAEILSRMNDRQAGKVMGAIDPLRAADITSQLRRLQQQVRQ